MSESDDAAAQLRRVLLALPRLDDDRAHSLTDVASAAGTNERTLLRDLKTLVERQGGEPAGFVEPVALAVDATSVRLEAPGFFRRPMGLTRDELHAIELGLTMLAGEAPPEERSTIDRARSRVRRALATATTDIAEDSTYAAASGVDGDERRKLLKTLQRCVFGRNVAKVTYQSANAAEPTPRAVRPLGFVYSRGRWYLVALTVGADELRVFRFDRVSAVDRLEERFEVPASFSLEEVVRDGRVLAGDAEEQLRIRYSPRIARWIAEREGLELETDGSVTVEMPLRDVDWAVRHALQYGTEAEVLGPERVRERMRDRLREIAG